MYQDEDVHSSLFLLIIHPNERTLQWDCQHSKQWLLQHKQFAIVQTRLLTRVVAEFPQGCPFICVLMLCHR